jgi:hypothetical protein
LGPSWKTAHDQVVRVLDQIPHEVLRQAAVEGDGVPVTLVEVVAGTDRRIARAQADGELGIALEAYLERPARETAEREHLPGDLEDRDAGGERELLVGARERQAELP